MKYERIFWDWNGTLVNDVWLAIEVANTLLRRRKLPLITNVNRYRQMFCFPVIDYYKKLGFNFENESFSSVAEEYAQLFNGGSCDLSLHDGARETLEMLHHKGVEQIVLSATEKRSLHNQMSFHGIFEYFTKILGLDDIYAVSKIQLCKTFLQTAQYKKALMIGDTLHDKQVADACGMDYVLISHGHSEKGTLHGCTVVDSFAELRNFLLP